MEGGAAIARTLFGDVNPSGKLPITFPRSLADSPAHVSARTFPGDGHTVHYDEELMVGYRHFDKHSIEPLFPFGHGLSYTDFEYSDLSVTNDCVTVEDSLQLRCVIRNSGDVAGSEVIQLYIYDQQPGDDRPPQSLKGFRKLCLQPGESSAVTLEVPIADLNIFCPHNNDWRAKPGRYTARVGSSSRDIRLETGFTIVAPDGGATR